MASAAGVYDSLAERLTVFQRLHGHEKTAAYTFELGRNHGHIPSPDGEGDIHGASSDHAQDAVKNSLPNDFRVVAVSAREGGWAVHRGGRKQPAIVNGREMLRVKGMRRIHVPMAIGYVAKSFSRNKIHGISAENERQRKQGLGPVEEKNRAVPLRDWIRSQPGEGWDLRSMRDRCADSVCPISPVMEGALNRLPHDGPAAEVRPQVSAVRIHNCDLPACLSISHQLPSQNALGEWLIP
jgi:hypothetical protein